MKMAQITDPNGNTNGQGPRQPIDNATSADIVVVGAGPVGLLMALKLSLQGITTIVIEKHKGILKAPRAIAYLPVVNAQLKKMGLLEPIAKRAFHCFLGPSWRPVQGEAHVLCDPVEKIEQLRKAGVDLPPLPPQDENCVYMIGQDELSEIILEQLRQRCPENISVRFQRSCTAVNNVPGGATVTTTDKSTDNKENQDMVLTAKYVIGADGAQSAVRQCASIPFEGFTWTNFRFTAADVEYDFQEEMNYYPGNFMVDPYNWAVIARCGPGNVFRIAYGELPETPDDDESLLERSKERIPAWLSPTNKNYKLRRLKPYWAQKRCAETFQKGRVLLIGDAAHSNNPIGGLGLTGGILDSVVVGNAIGRHLKGGEPEEIITRALESRRKTWLEVTNPTSSANYLRVCSVDEKVASEREEFFHKMNSDPAYAMGILADQYRLLPDAFEA